MNATTVTNDLRKRWRFFHRHAGGIVGQSAVYALRLARAEQWKEELEDEGLLRVRWEWDEDSDLSWLEEGETVNEVLGCILEIRCSECDTWHQAASLWGIADPDDNYRRVVEAELALEAMTDGD